MSDRQLHELDYLTTQDAADYCRVSLSQFREHAPALGIQPFRFMGKVVYRKSDLKSVLEETWRRSTSAASAGTSIGQMYQVFATEKASAKSRSLSRKQPAQPNDSLC